MTKEQKYRETLEQIANSCLRNTPDRSEAVEGFHDLVDLAIECLEEVDQGNFDDIPV